MALCAISIRRPVAVDSRLRGNDEDFGGNGGGKGRTEMTERWAGMAGIWILAVFVV